MKTKKKSNLLYKIIVAATFIIPISTYTLIYALLYSIVPNAIIFNETANVVERDKMLFVYAEENVNYDGYVVFDEELQTYGVLVDKDDIVKIDKDYFQYIDNQLVNVRDIKETQEKGSKVSLWFVLTALSIFGAIMFIVGKMKLLAGKLRLATLLGLVTVTLVLGILNLIISNMFIVFVIFTAEWLAYCIEYYVHTNGLKQTEKEKKESEMLQLLKQMIK